MPCCEWVLSVAASSKATTPSWLHRLHAKGGLSFPADLRIDDLFYGQPQLPLPRPLPLPPPPPPPPSSSDHQPKPQDPPPNPKPPRPPSRPNPSSSNSNPPQPQPQPQPLASVISHVFAVPSAEPSTRLFIKPFRKQFRPRPRPDDKSLLRPHKDAKVKARKRRRAERDADAERRTRTEVTVIDTSIEGWKAAKLLLRRGALWKIRDNKNPRTSEPEDLSKGKRRPGLVSKIQRDKEKGKDVALLANVGGSSGDVMKLLDGPAELLERSRWSEAVPILGQRTEVLLLSTGTFSQPN